MTSLAQTSDGNAVAGGLAVLLFLLIVAAFYFIPTIVAFVKKTPNKISVLVINLFLGWSFIGWVVALAMALRDSPAPQQVIVYTSLERSRSKLNHPLPPKRSSRHLRTKGCPKTQPEGIDRRTVSDPSFPRKLKRRAGCTQSRSQQGRRIRRERTVLS